MIPNKFQTRRPSLKGVPEPPASGGSRGSMRKIAKQLSTVVLVAMAAQWLLACSRPAVVVPLPAVTDKSEGPQAPGESARHEAEARERWLENERRRIAGLEASTAARRRFVEEAIYFGPDSAALTPQARTLLRNKAQWLREHPEVNIIIEGHCDSRGDSLFNLKLGERRAGIVKTYLIGLGVAPRRLKAVSFGKERPVAAGDSEAVHARNRRVEFVFDLPKAPPRAMT